MRPPSLIQPKPAPTIVTQFSLPPIPPLFLHLSFVNFFWGGFFVWQNYFAFVAFHKLKRMCSYETVIEPQVSLPVFQSLAPRLRQGSSNNATLWPPPLSTVQCVRSHNLSFYTSPFTTILSSSARLLVCLRSPRFKGWQVAVSSLIATNTAHPIIRSHLRRSQLGVGTSADNSS